jgi:membrane protein DedA with SNARE-associated domain
MAGIVEMPFPQFMLFNLAGATVWASVMVTLSFFLGRLIPLEQLISWAAKFAIVALILVIAWFTVPGWLESRKLMKQSSVASVEKQPSAPGE